MYGKFKNVKEFRAFLNRQIETLDKEIEDLNEKISLYQNVGNTWELQNHLAWRATVFLGTATHANLAKGFLADLEMYEVKDEDEVPAEFKERIFNKVTSIPPKVDSGSTLVASNLADAHEHSFYCEILGRL